MFTYFGGGLSFMILGASVFPAELVEVEEGAEITGLPPRAKVWPSWRRKWERSGPLDASTGAFSFLILSEKSRRAAQKSNASFLSVKPIPI